MKQLIKITDPNELKERDVILPMEFLFNGSDGRSRDSSTRYRFVTESTYDASHYVALSEKELATILSLEGVMVEREVKPMEFEGFVISCVPEVGPASVAFIKISAVLTGSVHGKRFKCVEIPEVKE